MKVTELLEDNHVSEEDGVVKSKAQSDTTREKYEIKLVWRNIIVASYIHVGSLYGLYLAFTSAKAATNLFAIFLYYATGFAVTAGTHRLWTHRAYKAIWPIHLILMLLQTMSYEDSVFKWVRDHRMHHKFSETNADPHNATRGFFFSHIGWVLCRKHPELREKGKQIDMSDIMNNPILAFQRKYYNVLFPLLVFIIPTVIPVYLWNETWSNAYHIAAVLRVTAFINASFLVNSVAHLIGNKPYDRNIYPSENKIVSFIALGEGWHNYHHTFPWDYKTSELGTYSFNYTTALINFFAKMGWAYDLKTVPQDMIIKRIQRTGDGSHEIWGWGDKDQTAEERNGARIINQRKKRKANFLMS